MSAAKKVPGLKKTGGAITLPPFPFDSREGTIHDYGVRPLKQYYPEMLKAALPNLRRKKNGVLMELVFHSDCDRPDDDTEASRILLRIQWILREVMSGRLALEHPNFTQTRAEDRNLFNQDPDTGELLPPDDRNIITEARRGI